jgi:hypothetical protein
MLDSPAALRRRAKSYRSISEDAGTAEVRTCLLHVADQIDRRADAWVKMTEPLEKNEFV